jgi:hypothetical protein
VGVGEGEGYLAFSWGEWVFLLKFTPGEVRLCDSELQKFVCELYGYKKGKDSTQG